ncbi:hypothetical protein ACFSO0_04550 [Brevibacillus sp. GCM10020057]|uniref:hypothetical protein n=1 Tax=Brevibacillus sp. GCM10020057 TaxID=3317327 RepID=UPI0036362D82
MDRTQELAMTEASLNLQPEFPESGTSLNPLEEPWWSLTQQPKVSTDSTGGE